VPAAAFGVLAVFTVVAIGAGLLAWWLIGSRIPLGPALPVLAAFGALYLSGHRLGLRMGPTMDLFGFQVALLFDVALAVVVALLVAWGGRLLSGPNP
jgi:hypothetical protein